MISNKVQLPIYEKEIDYIHIEKILDEEREKAKSFIDNNL